METTKQARKGQGTKVELQEQLAELRDVIKSQNARIEFLQQELKDGGQREIDADQETLDLMASVHEYETRAIEADNKIVQLEEQLAHAHDLLTAAQAAALSNPATATPPPGGHAREGLQPAVEGVIRLWIMTSTEGYCIRLIYQDIDGLGWSMSKQSDGTQYHLFEGVQGPITCDCPGCTKNGPYCAQGRGCKHVRMLKAIRAVVYPGIVTTRKAMDGGMAHVETAEVDQGA